MEEIKEMEKLPEGWKRVKLGEVVEILDNQRIPLDSEYRLIIKGDIPYCGSTGIIDYIRKYIFEGEYVLIAEDGGRFGRFEETAYIMKGKFWANNHVHIVKGKNKIIDNRFLMYLINFQDLNYYISGSTREKLNQQLLKTISVIYPSLPEQQKISEILETIDNAIEKTDKLIEKYKRIKQGLMQDLLTKGIDQNGNIRNEKTHKFKNSPIGRIPEEWNITRLGIVGEIEYGERLGEEDYNENGFSLVYGTGGLISKSEKYLEIGEAIIIPRKGTINSKYYIPKDQKFWVIDTGFYLKTSQNTKFLFYLLNNINFELLNEATGVPSLNRNNLRALIISLPSVSEQQKIAEILSQIDNVIEKEEKYKEKLQRIKQGLMEDLLTGKVRVNNLIEEISG